MSEKAAKELYAADIAVQEYFLQFCEGFPHGDGLANDVMSAANGCLNQELLASSMALLTEAGLATTSDLLTSIILMSPWLADTLASGELRKGLQEVARASSPVHTATARYIAEDVSLGDAKLQRGDRVLILLDAANHDPLAFECPFTLNVIHTNNRNIAFGSGRHRCPGSKLARVLSESVAFTLLEEMGLTARIAGPLSRAPTASGVGISAAPVEVIRAVE
jgi:cytochrome P450